MPRKPRFYVPGAPVHAVQRGHNRSAVFFADLDYLEYLRCLKQAADSCGCAVHAYVLMTNHVHLLLSPEGVAWQGDGQRCQPDLAERLRFHQDCADWLQRHARPWVGIGGDWAQREVHVIEQVRRLLG